ncbi:hypothetical protein HBB16_11885 [Pseudonocardia sp. MCCB 268]|nr:hypothetical protein [Pseudonocardia cytotoxica]
MPIIETSPPTAVRRRRLEERIMVWPAGEAAFVTAASGIGLDARALSALARRWRSPTSTRPGLRGRRGAAHAGGTVTAAARRQRRSGLGRLRPTLRRPHSVRSRSCATSPASTAVTIEGHPFKVQVLSRA